MANERLRDALNSAGLTTRDVADEVGVDPKTVERWISRDRLPYPRHRVRLAAMLNENEHYLWPAAVSDERRSELSESELIRIHPRRAEVPRDTWTRLLNSAVRQIDVLVHAGLSLAEHQPELAQTLCDKVAAGVEVRLLLADSDGEQGLRRGGEEGIGDVVVSRVKNALSFYEPHAAHGCIQVRLHDTTLYNSIFRFDNEMLVNSHVFGLSAADAPVLHLRHIRGGELFTIYESSYERVWSTAVSAWPHLQAV